MHSSTRVGPRRRMFRAVLATAAAAATAAGLLAGASPANAATTVKGMDVSHYQGTVNWSSNYSKGARFAYIKATESTSYTDPQFNRNYTASRSAGFIRGAYHFARPASSSGATQAKYFSNHGGGWSADGKTLPPALDMEYNPSGSTCYGLSHASMVSWIKSFSNYMHTRWHKYPMIYTTFDWWNTCTGNSSAFAKTNPFWIARYSSSQPSAPAGTATWTIWQYASSGTFAGDQDKFNGSMTRLKALAKNRD
ncbi:MAG: lysozyme [Actinocatenispora sp.]